MQIRDLNNSINIIQLSKDIPMKKILLPFLLAFTLGVLISPLNSQSLVSTNPENRKAVIEEFTGLSCPYCPEGHVVADGIANKYPGKALVVAYHPSNGSFNTPYTAAEDLRRQWPASFWGTFSGTTSMPSAMINRIPWNAGPRGIGRGGWEAAAVEVMKVASPCNVGLISGYDVSTKKLTVDVEVYFTSAVTDQYSIYVVLTEDSIVTHQRDYTISGNGNWRENYVHKRTFREALTDVNGDPISGNTSKGTLVTKKYTFTNSQNYVISRCSVLVFIRNKSNDEIVTGNIGSANAQTLFLTTTESLFSSAASSETVEKVFTVKNISTSSKTLNITSSKSQRTPSDWTTEVALPPGVLKNGNSPQGSVSLNPGESKDITLKFTPGATVGVGDAVLTVQEISPGKGTQTMQLTVVSSNIEYLEILDDDSEGSTLLTTIKATGREQFLRFDAEGFIEAQPYLNNIKYVVWTSGLTGGISKEEATAISQMLDKGARVLISGASALSTLYYDDSENPLFSKLGVTWDSETGTLSNTTFTLAGMGTDKKFSTMNLPSTLRTGSDNLQPILIKDAQVASPILKINGTSHVMGAKTQTSTYKVITLHFDPLAISLASGEQKLIDSCLTWLEETVFVGPVASLSTEELSFGDIKAGKDKELEVEISNNGDQPLELKKIEITGTGSAAFSITSGSIDQVKSIAPGEKHTVTVKFAPPSDITATTNYQASLDLTSNVGSSEVYNVALKGTGIYEPDGVEDEQATALQVSATPNPVGSEAAVTFTLNGSLPSNVEAVLIDASGKTVRTIFNDAMIPGTVTRSLTTTGLASGAYYIIVKSQSGNLNIPIIINK